jgi:hypothetical protein
MGQIDVTCVRLERDVRPADWLEVKLSEGATELLTIRRAPTLAGEVLDARARSVSRSGDAMIRSTAIKDADRLFVLSARAKTTDFDAVEPAIQTAFESFTLAHPNGGVCAEDLHRYGRREPFAPLFYHPKGLSAAPDETSNVEATGVHLRDQASKLSPFMGVYRLLRAAEDDDPKRVFAIARRVLAKKGIDTAPADPILVPPRHGFSHVWEAQPKADRRCEVLLTVLEHPSAWCLAATIVPERSASTDDWMRGRRAHDIVSQTLRVVHG